MMVDFAWAYVLPEVIRSGQNSIDVTFARFSRSEALTDRPVEEGNFFRLGGLTVVSSGKLEYSRFHETWTLGRDEVGNHVIKDWVGAMLDKQGIISIVLPVKAYPTRMLPNPQNAVTFADNRLCLTWPCLKDGISFEVHMGS